MRTLGRHGGLGRAAVFALAAAALPVQAQEARPERPDPQPHGAAEGQPRPSFPILIFDRARVLSQSEAGQALEARIDEARAALLAENEQIYADLEAEEQRIADERPQMSEQEFRTQAAAFDTRVTETRARQDEKAHEVQELYDNGIAEIEAEMNAVLTAVARDLGAFLVFERQQVYLMSGAIDISEIVIDRLDAGPEDAGPAGDAAPPEDADIPAPTQE
ncbi:OmpH family outer membrane protein [Celeribacter indicus]|uniref:Outer membrane protein n=1 Tax=Celeribacter indicus TaxID=1208324 RepID=A0A0B5DWA7_9RHOB|nr:OmpH family outer membrane protein [Celeribacter indicus]AJE47329.1 outer membrane protein [Celeribacter indicus]SDW03617.1 periplasmic chaperone for outer membrane proteins Skp [Celeribacter indicus]